VIRISDMTQKDFENDFIARKTTRYLLVFEISSFLIALILLFFNATLIAFTVATLTLIIFIGVFLWLFIRFRTFPIVQEKFTLQQKVSDLQSNIKLETNEINRANQKRKQLSEAEHAELDLALEKLQKTYIQNGLGNTRLDSAKIPGIGPKLKERLAIHRIVTAADVNSNISSIEGFGEAKSQALLSWQRNVHDELNRTRPTILPNDVAENIKQKYLLPHEENNVAEANAEKNKQIYEGNLNSFRP